MHFLLFKSLSILKSQQSTSLRSLRQSIPRFSKVSIELRGDFQKITAKLVKSFSAGMKFVSKFAFYWDALLCPQICLPKTEVLIHSLSSKINGYTFKFTIFVNYSVKRSWGGENDDNWGTMIFDMTWHVKSKTEDFKMSKHNEKKRRHSSISTLLST